jgi:hypothetical protein
MDLHNITIKRVTPESELPDINFFLETDKLVQFCDFFKQLG